MRPTAAVRGDDDDAPIRKHYVLVLVIEALILAGLAWLGASYR